MGVETSDPIGGEKRKDLFPYKMHFCVWGKIIAHAFPMIANLHGTFLSYNTPFFAKKKLKGKKSCIPGCVCVCASSSSSSHFPSSADENGPSSSHFPTFSYLAIFPDKSRRQERPENFPPPLFLHHAHDLSRAEEE